jgi:uncharacterized protein (DUF1800 family)
MSVNAAVDQLIHFPPTDSLPPAPEPYNPLQEFPNLGTPAFRQQDDMTKRAAFLEIGKQERQSVLALQLWWLNRMLATPAPLQEKMAFYFHGHFTSAAVQKGVTPQMMLNQNQLFRNYALGDLRELTWNVSIDPAMLIYLDNGTNAAAHPNENYARELMELFTLGLNNYTEEDIRQSARAWTGWIYNQKTQSVQFVPRRHDNGEKTFLGRTGNFDGRDIVNIIFAQPQCARWFATSLLNFYVYNDPEPQLVDAVAALIRKNGYQLAPVMSVLLRSNVFFSNRAYRALVKSPVEFVVGTYKALGLTEIDNRALGALNQMGQVLFYPPNVAGWPGGTNWVTSQTIISRENFIAGLVNSPMMTQSTWVERVPMDATSAAREIADTILYGDVSSAAFAQITDYLNGAATSALGTLSAENYQERVRGAAYLTMAMPAYQLN